MSSGPSNPNRHKLSAEFSNDSFDLSDRSDSFSDYDDNHAPAITASPSPGKQTVPVSNSFKGFIARSMSGITDRFGTVESDAHRPKNIERQPSKLRRTLSNIGEHYKDLIGAASYFQNWSRTELINVLVDHGVEVRNEHHLTIDTLRDIADEAFEEFINPPEKPPGYTMAELKRLDAAAYVIQEVWFRKNKLLEVKAKKNKKYRAKQKKLYIQRSSSNIDDIQEVLETAPENSFSMYADMARQSYAFDEEEVALHLAPSVSVDEEAMQSEGSAADGMGSLKMKMALEQPYIPPSFDFAEHFADLSHPRRPNATRDKYSVLNTSTGRHCMQGGMGEVCDYWEEKQVSEFSQFGPGVTNYYKFLKWCYWMFITLGGLYSIEFCANVFGNAFEEEFSVVDIALGSVAHLGGFGENSTIALEVPAKLCEMNVFNRDCAVTSETAAYLYVAITFLATIALVIGYVWLRTFELHEERVWNESSVSAGSYSVVVHNLPKDITTMELRAHFAKVIDESVVDVILAFDNEYEIGMYMKRGDLVKKRYSVTQEYRYYQAMKSDKEMIKKLAKDSVSLERKLADIAKARASLTDEILNIDQAVKMHEDENAKRGVGPIAAFVTFDGPMARDKALRTYGRSWFGFLYTRPFLRLKNKNIVLEGAPEPSTVIWENLAYTYKTRTIFRFFTFIVSLFLLAVSAVASYAPSVLGNLASVQGGEEDCPMGFENWSSDDQRDYAIEHSGAVHCYCDGLDFFEQPQEPVCEEYFRAQLFTQIIIYGAACIVLVINAVIDYAIRVCARWEKHHTVEEMERAIFIRMWFAKIINTGLTFIFASNYSMLGPYVPFELPAIEVFSQEWFKTVGVNIVLVQLGNIFTIHAVKTARYIHMHWRLWKARRGKLLVLTQDELNMMHMGPDFILSRRYAQVLADMTVCLLFCSGIPILAVIAAFNFYISYWIDKFMFLRFYRTPPKFNAEIGKLATRLIPLAILGHIVVAIWMYGTSPILATGYTGQETYHQNVDRFDAARLRDKLNQRHITGLIGLLVIVLLAVIIDEFVRSFMGLIRLVMKGACGAYLTKSDYLNKFESFLNSHVQIKYSRALTRGLIKGLTNYNILQNPIYKHAFNISDEFAENHKSLRSIRNRVKFSYFGEDKVFDKQKSFEEPVDPALEAELRRRQFAEETPGSSSFDLSYLINPATAAAMSAAAPSNPTVSSNSSKDNLTPRNRLAEIAASGTGLTPRGQSSGDSGAAKAQQRKSLTRPPAEAAPAPAVDSTPPVSGSTPKAQQRKSFTRPVPTPINTDREVLTHDASHARRHSVRRHEDQGHGGIPIPQSAAVKDDRRQSIRADEAATKAAASLMASAAEAKRRGSHRAAQDSLDHSGTSKKSFSETDPSVPYSSVKRDTPRSNEDEKSDSARGQRKSLGYSDPRPSPVSNAVRNTALDMLSSYDQSTSPLSTSSASSFNTAPKSTAPRNSLRADESLMTAPRLASRPSSPSVVSMQKTAEKTTTEPASDVSFSTRYGVPNKSTTGSSAPLIPATVSRQSLGESVAARKSGVSSQLGATSTAPPSTARPSLRANEQELVDAPLTRRAAPSVSVPKAPVVPVLNLSSVLVQQSTPRLTPRLDPSPRQNQQTPLTRTYDTAGPTRQSNPKGPSLSTATMRSSSPASSMVFYDSGSDDGAKEFEI